jgi:predicted nucleic acid-binding Zn ribbon protein
MKKAFGVPAVHFKGSGWARKDRSTTNKPGRAERKDSGSGSDQGAESSPTGDSSKPPADAPATGGATTDSD